MTMIAGPTLYTPEEIERLSEQDGKIYELIKGQSHGRYLFFGATARLNLYRTGDELKDEPLLPGLVFKVADIFPAPPAAATNT